MCVSRSCFFLFFFFLLIPRSPRSTLFPYTTLFRSGLIQLLAQLLVLILQLYRIPPRRFGRLHPFQSNRGARICPVLFRRNPTFTGSRKPLDKYTETSFILPWPLSFASRSADLSGSIAG